MGQPGANAAPARTTGSVADRQSSLHTWTPAISPGCSSGRLPPHHDETQESLQAIDLKKRRAETRSLADLCSASWPSVVNVLSGMDLF
jgi:hypothetical protein